MVRLDDLNIFVCIADNKSFSAASRVLNISPAVVSASVKRLEQSLNAKLFVRSTRSLSMTQVGELYLQHAKTALDAVRLGESEIVRSHGEISGRLSVSLPSDLGRGYLRKMIDEFQALHPALEIKVMISDRIADLYKSQVDIAIRYGTPADSNLIALPLVSDNHRVICASPAYFTKFGKPQQPADLQTHNCLCFMLNHIVHNKWQFGFKGETQLVYVKGNKVADDGDLVRQWAVDGRGIVYKSRLDVLEDIRNGLLETALDGFTTEAAPLNFITAQQTHSVPAASALIDYLRNAFRRYLNE